MRASWAMWEGGRRPTGRWGRRGATECTRRVTGALRECPEVLQIGDPVRVALRIATGDPAGLARLHPAAGPVLFVTLSPATLPLT